MTQPPIDNDLDHLEPYVKARVERIFAAMRSHGYDPVAFETRRSIERQQWLYGVGRTHDKKRRPVTWTLQSRHLAGKAVDVISKKHGWSDPAFYVVLHHEAGKEGMSYIPQESCHIQWNG